MRRAKKLRVKEPAKLLHELCEAYPVMPLAQAASIRQGQRLIHQKGGAAVLDPDLQRVANWLGPRATVAEAMQLLKNFDKKDDQQKEEERQKSQQRQQGEGKPESPDPKGSPQPGTPDPDIDPEKFQPGEEGSQEAFQYQLSPDQMEKMAEKLFSSLSKEEQQKVMEELREKAKEYLRDAESLLKPFEGQYEEAERRKIEQELKADGEKVDDKVIKKLAAKDKRETIQLSPKAGKAGNDGSHGGISAQWGNKVERYWSLRAIALFDRLIEIAGDGDERGGRIHVPRLMGRLLSKQGGLVHARKAERGYRKILWLPDCSGSCAAIADTTLTLARSICMQDDRHIICRHSNGCPDKEKDDPFPYPGNSDGWAKFCKEHDIGLAVALGDTDAIGEYHQIAASGVRLLWLDSRVVTGSDRNRGSKAVAEVSPPWDTYYKYEELQTTPGMRVNYISSVTPTTEGFVKALDLAVRVLK